MQVPTEPKTFAAMVNEDFRGIASAEDAAFLRLPQNLDPWYDELVTILRSFDNQLAGQKRKSAEARLAAQRDKTMDGWLEQELRVMDWRGHIFNYRRYIEVRLREIRRLRNAAPNKYRQAIEDHRNAYAQDPQGANDALWAMIEGHALVAERQTQGE